MSLLTTILRQALKRGSATAVVDDRGTYSYTQLLGGACYVADWLDNTCPSERVGLLLPSSGGFVVSLLGGWLGGKTVVPLNFLLGPQELQFVIQDSQMKALITVEPMLEMLGHPTFPGVRILKLEDLPKDPIVPFRMPPLYDADDLAALLYTSGTSGKPKGVMLTHGNLESDVNAAIEHVNLTRADTFLGLLPQFHSFGFTALTLIPLSLGSKVVYSARFIPRRIIGLIREHRPDIFMAVPSMYGALLGVKNATPEDWKSVRLPVSGGEPLPQAVYDKMQSRFGVRMLEGYGLTETSPATHWSLPQTAKRNSVGSALPGVRTLIVDGEDRTLPVDQEGEILLGGPIIMKGYRGRPDLDEQVFVELVDPSDGKRCRFFRTGDIGHVDGDGMLFITGRKKEMLIVGGENVFPREIEEVLDQHESVLASAVIGLADEMRGEVVLAFVELEEGCTLDEAVLRSYCREHLAGYKVPRQIRSLDALPRNPTGKILRRALKEQLE